MGRTALDISNMYLSFIRILLPGPLKDYSSKNGYNVIGDIRWAEKFGFKVVFDISLGLN